jgi:predicted transposase/invertase (TIGR01784 family)
MTYDNTCKFIAEQFSADIASWLLGESVVLSRLEPSELSLEPIRADALILLQSRDIVLHCEFQTDPDPDMPFRMLDYRLRVYRRYPGRVSIGEGHHQAITEARRYAGVSDLSGN